MSQRRDEIEYWLSEHLRLNGVYWGLTALHLLNHPEGLPRDETVRFVLSCQNADGGFGAAPGHDSHMLYSVSAVQILATIDALQELYRPGFDGPEQVGRCELAPDTTAHGELTVRHRHRQLAAARHRNVRWRLVGRDRHQIPLCRTQCALTTEPYVACGRQSGSRTYRAL